MEWYSRPDRLKPIAERFELDSDAVLENVIFARAHTSEHQMELINKCAAKFAEERNTYRLLVR
jgi:meiotic recombination protein DMC1